jgi:hypothetical protein
VCTELRKTPRREPSRGLVRIRRNRIMKSIAPEPTRITDVDAWLACIDRATRPVRLAALCAPLVADDAPVRHLVATR